ncbi:DUF1206 domain-containing protein [Plantactinospora sp. GCM10030261]|uniref:DUF1206 domain-containing protein n=1 Tax=Plantactinospora sp. GCM10030261 TaxID=3273420 RepID=UPI003607E975
MSVTHGAQSTASRAADSKPLEALARAGFIGYGLVHLLLAWLALQIAFGNANQEGDQSGAMQTLAKQPLGKTLLVAVAIGLAAMALWQALEAAFGHRQERGRSRTLERLASVGRTVMYSYFAYTAYKVFSDANSSSADSQQQWSEQMMSSTGGRWLVGLAGVGLAALGIGMVVYGIKKKFLKHLHTGRMSAKTRQLSQRLGMAGYTAKGSVYGVAGLLVVVAAVTYDPNKARGLDAALRTLRDQPYGQVILVLMALGLAAFAAYCIIQSRYRKV